MWLYVVTMMRGASNYSISVVMTYLRSNVEETLPASGPHMPSILRPSSCRVLTGC